MEAFYGFVGFFVSTFQMIEAKFDEIILICVGAEKWHIGQSVVSVLSNREKIEFVHSMVMSSAISDGTTRQREWLVAFEKIIQRVKELGDRRNKIVHSTYLFDFMKIGHPPLRSKRRKRRGKIEFDREHFDLVSMNKMADELLELAFDVGLMKTQLMNWFDDAIRPAQ